MAVTVNLGDEIEMRAVFQLPPDEVVAYVRHEHDELPVKLEVDRVDERTFVTHYTPSLAGQWNVRIEGKGSNKGAVQSRFRVRESNMPS